VLDLLLLNKHLAKVSGSAFGDYTGKQGLFARVEESKPVRDGVYTSHGVMQPTNDRGNCMGIIQVLYN